MLGAIKHLKIVGSRYLCLFLAWLLIAVLTSCSIREPLPEVDLSAPGWKVWTGQALWQPETDRSAIAGEIVLAIHNNGDVLVNFAKPPVPIFTAQTAGKYWKIDFIYTQSSHSGRRGPPSRFIWFQVPALIRGAKAPEDWQVQAVDDTTWELHKPKSGEHIRLVLDT